MSGIGSISGLATQLAQAAQVNMASSVQSVAEPDSAAESGSAGAPANRADFSADYAMSLLAKITRANADQALTLIKTMSVSNAIAGAPSASGPIVVDPLWGRRA
jgi:hypothetical protein